MLKLSLVLISVLVLNSCQQVLDQSPSKEKWKGSVVGAIGGVPTYYLLDCRSLKSEEEHHYFSIYMPLPTSNDFFEFQNEEGHTITSIPNAELWHEKVTVNGNSTNHKTLHGVKVDFEITEINHRHYRYEIIANAETLAYFARYGTEETRRIVRDEAFVIVDYDGSRYRVLKHPNVMYVQDSNFTCRKAQQGRLVER